LSGLELSALKKLKLSGDLEQDAALFQSVFDKDFTLKIRFVDCKTAQYRFCVIFFDGMIANALVDHHVLYPLSRCDGHILLSNMEDVARYVLTTDQAVVTNDLHTAVSAMLYGDTLILMDGSKHLIAASTKGFQIRSVSEPDGEKLVRGPREGFTEAVMINTSLLRRKLQTPDLKFDLRTIPGETNVRICLCYLASVVDQSVLCELNKRLEAITADALLDSNCLTEMIRDRTYSPFKTIGSTEKPDVAAAKLLEGKVVIMVDGTPVALTLPFLFLEYFQKGDDYYTNFVYGSVSRLLRILGFFLSVSVPAIYLALVTYHYEIIPTKLLLSITAARQGVPFPTLLEMILLLVAFELLREAGAMMPASVGQALSTVGAIVVGQAAVEARIVSAPMVIVLALTGLTGMMSPKMQSPVLLLRLVFLILAAFFGLYGYLFGVCILLLYLMSKKSFGLSYMSFLNLNNWNDLRDTLLRMPRICKKRSGDHK